MKINSNTVLLEKDQFKLVENIITKIASDNNIENVKSISVQLDPTQGIIKFKSAGIEEDELKAYREQYWPEEDLSGTKSESWERNLEIANAIIQTFGEGATEIAEFVKNYEPQQSSKLDPEIFKELKF